jgi:hypothetical protein
MPPLLQWIIGVALTLTALALTPGLWLLSNFLRRLDKSLDDFKQSQTDHETKDDERFDKVDAKLDAFRDDTVTKRHAFRSEVHTLVAEVELRLTRDVMRVEGKIDKVG